MSLWLFLALLVPFILGVVLVLDKLIVERYAPTIYFYAFWVAIFELAIGGATLLGLSFDQVEARALWGGLLAGVIGGCSFLALLAALSRGQLARIAPVYFLYPLMVAPMSGGFLGEELTAVIWGAIALAVLGAGLVSWQAEGGAGAWSQPSAQGFALLAAALFAVAAVISKYMLDDEPFWHFYGASRMGFGLGLGAVTVLSVEDVRRRGPAMIGNGKFIGLVILTELFATGAIGANLGAINAGPVSLVSAIGALQPTVILVYSMALARLAPVGFGGWVTSRNMGTQVAGIAAITSAVVVISLQ